MTLGTLIEWLNQQDPDLIVKDGFSLSHNDIGDYKKLCFIPIPETKIGDMLDRAQSALGTYFWENNGGKHKMTERSSVYIGALGSCGKEITLIHFKHWLRSGTKTCPNCLEPQNDNCACMRNKGENIMPINPNPDDKTLLAAYKYVESMTTKSNFVLHFGSLRGAFLAGVAYNRELSESSSLSQCVNCKHCYKNKRTCDRIVCEYDPV